jgi:YfiR/HmsC-like
MKLTNNVITRARHQCWLTLMIGGFCCVFCSLASATDLTKKLKTLYIINIIKFVSWAEDKNFINLCVYDTSDIYAQTLSISNKPIGQGRRLRVISNPTNNSQCDIFYWDKTSISHRKTDHSNNSSNDSTNDSTNALEITALEITDIQGPSNKEMDVQLYVEDNKLRFSINKKENSRRFSISSELMRLSRSQEKK